MDKKYRVVFLGLLEREKKEDFSSRMSAYGVTAQILERMIAGIPIVLKADMTLGDARAYADAVQRAGGKVNIQEHGYVEASGGVSAPLNIPSFENFIMCQECGYKQLKSRECVKCGSSLEDA